MDASTEAADFVVRESLTLMIDSVKLLLKGTGKGAVRSLVLLAAVMKSQHRTKGAVRLASLLRSGAPLEVLTLPEDQLGQWHNHAKEYGILYTVIRSHDRDGQVDLVIRKEDAARVARIMERFHLEATPQASITAEVQPDLQEGDLAQETFPRDAIDDLIDSILSPDTPETAQEKATQPVMTDEEVEGLFGSADPTEGKSTDAPQETPSPALSPKAPSETPSRPLESEAQGKLHEEPERWTFARVNREWPLSHPKEEFNEEQRMEIHKGFEKGLSPVQIEQYAKPENDPMTMAVIREATRPSVAEAMSRVRAQRMEEKKTVKVPVHTPAGPEV